MKIARPSNAPRPSKVLLATVAAALAVVSTACGAGTQTLRFSRKKLPPDVTVAALQRAMRAGGFEQLRANSNEASGRVTGTRYGGNVLSGSTNATLSFKPVTGDENTYEFVVDISRGAGTGLGMGSADDLRRKAEQQLRNVERDLQVGGSPVASKSLSAPIAGFPTGTDVVPSGKGHALIVGISRYSDSSFSTLKGADHDARVIEEVVKDSKTGLGIPAQRVHVLVDEEATRASIMQKLIEMTRESEEDDLLIFFFAGHGTSRGEKGGEAYLVPADGTQRELEGRCISKRDLIAQLDEAPAKHQLLMLDACFFGPTRAVTDGDYFGVFESERSGVHRAVLSSATGSQSALDAEGSSPFVSAFVECVRDARYNDADGSGALSMTEILGQVKPRVQRIAEGMGYSQTPVVVGSVDLAPIHVRN